MCAADLAAGSLQATFEARAAARHETAEAAFPLATVIPWVSQAGQALFADGVRMHARGDCVHSGGAADVRAGLCAWPAGGLTPRTGVSAALARARPRDRVCNRRAWSGVAEM